MKIVVEKKKKGLVFTVQNEAGQQVDEPVSVPNEGLLESYLTLSDLEVSEENLEKIRAMKAGTFETYDATILPA